MDISTISVPVEAISKAITGNDAERRARAQTFQQLRLREEFSGVARSDEPLDEIDRYLSGELTLGELVDVRLHLPRA